MKNNVISMSTYFGDCGVKIVTKVDKKRETQSSLLKKAGETTVFLDFGPSFVLETYNTVAKAIEGHNLWTTELSVKEPYEVKDFLYDWYNEYL